MLVLKIKKISSYKDDTEEIDDKVLQTPREGRKCS